MEILHSASHCSGRRSRILRYAQDDNVTFRIVSGAVSMDEASNTVFEFGPHQVSIDVVIFI